MADEIQIKNWVKRGKMIVRSDALDWDDKDHPYNQAKAQGANPEDFGMKHPLYERYSSYSKDQLIEIISDLELLVKNKEFN